MSALAEIPLVDLLAEVRRRRAALLRQVEEIDKEISTGAQTDAHRVIGAATAVWQVTPSELIGTVRTRLLTEARHAAMAWLRGRGWALEVIGRCFGGRDHATVMNAVKMVADKIATDAAFAAKWEVFRKLLDNETSETNEREQP